jgi:hypothetical protein
MKAIEIIQEKIKSIIAADNTEGKIINAILLLGITVEDEGSESIEERLDVMLSEFNLASKVVDWKGLENAFKLFKEFNLNIKEQSDNEFLDSIEIINLILKIHHYQDIGYVTAKELSKINAVYEVFGKKLKELKLKDIELIGRLEINAINKLGNTTEEELKLLCNFIKELNVKFSSTYEELKSIAQLQELLEELHYKENSWLTEKEISKILLVFNEFEISKIEKWKGDTIESLSIIAKEFELNLPEVSKLVLKRKISEIKKLNIEVGSGANEIKSRLEVIKYLKVDLEGINQLEISKIVKISEILGINLGMVVSKDNYGIKAILEWIEGKGIKLEISKVDERTFEELKKIKEKLELVTGKKVKDLDIRRIELAEKLLSGFGIEEISDAEVIELKKVAHIIATSIDDIKGENYYRASDLNEVFRILNLDLNALDKAQYEKTKKHLDNFGVKIVELSESDATNLVSVMVSLGMKKGEELISKLELNEAVVEAIKVFEYNGLMDMDGEEIEKLILLTSAVGVREISELKKSDIDKIKAISEGLEFKFRVLSKEAIETLVYILNKEGLKEVESKQGWLSWAIEGREAAFKEKLVAIKNKIKAVGYKEVLEFKEERYEELDKLLVEQGKSFAKIGLEELKKFGKLYQSFGYDISEDGFYKLEAFSKALKAFGVLPFEAILVEEKNLKVIEEASGSKIGDLSEGEIKNLTELGAKYGLNIKSNNFERDYKKLKESYKLLGFLELSKVGEESKLCMADLEALSSKNNNLEKLSSVMKLIREFVPKLEEMVLAECKNLYHFLKPMQFDVGSEKVVNYKSELIISVSKKCKLDFEEEVNSRVTNKVSGILIDLEEAELCKSAKENVECKNMSKKVIDDMDAITNEICQQDHEDL